jgi:uncharacterized protein (UPF0261 family)
MKIAISVADSTKTTVTTARQWLEDRHCSVVLFIADGIGGQNLERRVLACEFAGVLDLTITELAAELLKLPDTAGPNRMTAAAMAAIPQVLSVGGSDRVGEHILTPEEADRLGQDFAQRACASNSPTAIMLPTRLYATEPPTVAFKAMIESIRNWAYGVEMIDVNSAMDEPAFAESAASTLHRMLAK